KRCRDAPNTWLSDLTYADTKPIIDMACVPCHNPHGQAAFLPLHELLRINRKADDMWEEVLEGEMPRGNPGFRRTPEARTLLTWLSRGDLWTDVPPDPPDPTDDGGGDDGDAALTYAEVLPIIQLACVGCHNPSGMALFLPFETFADIEPFAPD